MLGKAGLNVTTNGILLDSFFVDFLFFLFFILLTCSTLTFTLTIYLLIAFSRYERTHPNFVSAAGIEIFGLQIGRPSKFLQGLWASFLCPLGTKRG